MRAVPLTNTRYMVRRSVGVGSGEGGGSCGGGGEVEDPLPQLDQRTVSMQTKLIRRIPRPILHASCQVPQITTLRLTLRGPVVYDELSAVELRTFDARLLPL